MTLNNFIMRGIAGALVFLLCGVPQLLAQITKTPPSVSESGQQTALTLEQQASAGAPQTPSGTQGNQPTDPRFSGAKPDPSAGPQQPTLSPQVPYSRPQVPDAPSAVQQQEQQSTPAQTVQQPTTQTVQQPTTQREAPAGTAAAEKGTTSGGAASKPAGMAIAPAGQHRVRSMVVKFGLIGAGAVALGTVVALTRATPSSPPGSTRGVSK